MEQEVHFPMYHFSPPPFLTSLQLAQVKTKMSFTEVHLLQLTHKYGDTVMKVIVCIRITLGVTPPVCLDKCVVCNYRIQQIASLP